MEIAEFDEKKNKRAAANVNERRRMQNINNGFEALRGLINVQNAAKLSKSAILRHSVEMLRNLMSENQQLREQNTFMRNLYCNSNISSMPPPPQPPKLLKKELFKNEDNLSCNNNIETPSKKVQVVYNSEDYLTEEKSIQKKSPKKNSFNINKLLASPKRMTRSSVIQENHAYVPSSYPILESPTRRSLRLMEKDNLISTPPSTKTSATILDFRNGFTSPISRTKINIEQKGSVFFTPEYVKNIPARGAKRSLDAIIHAIDHLENC